MIVEVSRKISAAVMLTSVAVTLESVKEVLSLLVRVTDWVASIVEVVKVISAAVRLTSAAETLESVKEVESLLVRVTD